MYRAKAIGSITSEHGLYRSERLDRQAIAAKNDRLERLERVEREKDS